MDPFIGEIRIFAGNYAPEGWLLCQGQTLQVSTYQALFAILGTYYGGNGTQNFCLPNLQGRFVIGVGVSPSGQTYAIGQKGGVEQVALTVGNLAVHTHPATSPTHTHSISVPAHTHAFDVPPHAHPFSPQCDNNGGGDANPGGQYPGQGGSYSPGHGQTMGAQTTGQNADIPGTTGQSAATSGASGATAAAVSVQTAGNGVPFNTVPLYLAINYIIAYTGVFPPRS